MGGEGRAWIVQGQRRPRGHEGGSKAGISEDINVFAQGIRGVVEVGRDVLDVWLQVSVGPRDQGLVRTATRTIVAPQCFLRRALKFGPQHNAAPPSKF